jgi:hypothetical protein
VYISRMNSKMKKKEGSAHGSVARDGSSRGTRGLLLPRFSLKLREEDGNKRGKLRRIRGRGSEDGGRRTLFPLCFDLASVVTTSAGPKTMQQRRPSGAQRKRGPTASKRLDC